MNKIFLLAVGIFVLINLAFTSALGLSYGQTSANVAGDQEICFTYGLYNSDSSATKATVEVRGEMKEFLVSAQPTINVPAKTAPKDSVKVNACFNIPKEDCGEGQRYSGNLVVMQIPPEGISGSAASVGAAAPLEVICGAASTSSEVSSGSEGSGFGRFFFPVVAVLLIVGIIVILYKKKVDATQSTRSDDKE